MEIKWIYLIVGIVIGWITKAPFLIKYYKEIKRDKDTITRGVEYVRKLNEK